MRRQISPSALKHIDGIGHNKPAFSYVKKQILSSEPRTIKYYIYGVQLKTRRERNKVRN
jgi:hypothetical protein